MLSAIRHLCKKYLGLQRESRESEKSLNFNRGRKMEKGHCGSEELELGKGIATTEQMLILHGTPGINAKG